MAENERHRRRGLMEVLEFAREKQKGVVNIESKKSIVSAVNFEIEKEVRKKIKDTMKKGGEEYVELISGDYFVYDVTDKLAGQLCKSAWCENQAIVLETRLIFAYDGKDQEYQLGEFSPAVRTILQATRKRAAICEDHIMEAQIRGETLDIYQRIPEIGELATVSRIKKGYPVTEVNLFKPAFGNKKGAEKTTAKGADVIYLFDKKKK